MASADPPGVSAADDSLATEDVMKRVPRAAVSARSTQ